MKNKLVFVVTLVLFLIPFFWLKPGEMDLGGDSNRLYYYAPIEYIVNTSIYDIPAEGKGFVEPNYYFLPFVGMLAALKFFIHSSYLLICIHNGLLLSLAFLSIYLIICEFIGKKESQEVKNTFAAVLGGIFYVLSFGSKIIAVIWPRALISIDQIFLNPLLFYLMLKFFLTRSYIYLWISLLITFIFSANFGMPSAPGFFAFYPLATIFLLMYTIFIKKVPVPWKGIVIGLVLFLGIHSFHLVGQVVSLFDSGSFTNNKVFNPKQIQSEVEYFSAIHGLGKISLDLLLPSAEKIFHWSSFTSLFVIIFAFLLRKTKKKLVVLLSFFFIVTLFLASANITHIGYIFYRSLFYIPGFSMFRNFYVQWFYIFVFFYSLLFGMSVYTVLLRIKSQYIKPSFAIVFFLLTINAVPFILGRPINEMLWGSKNIPGTFIMDPRYETTLQFIRNLPDNGKILVLPLGDFFHQVIYGRDGGAYIGPSTIRHLTRKYAYVAYQNLYPYPEDILKYSREKNYNNLLSIFAVLNIRYIFHNSDANIYDKNLTFPFSYVRTSLPKTQEEYKKFIQKFPVKQLYKNGPYVIYELDKSAYNPTIFIPESIYTSNSLSFDPKLIHSVFIEENVCNKKEYKMFCSQKNVNSSVKLSYKMINPTLYEVHIQQEKPVDSLLLVLQHTFHTGWKLKINNTEISKSTHVPVNGYANGWFLSTKDIPRNKNYTIYIELEPQKYFWYGLYITGISLMALFISILLSAFKKNEKS